MRICDVCGEARSCSSCLTRERKRLWAQAKRNQQYEAVRAKERAYYDANKDTILQKGRSRHADNRQSDNETSRRWKLANKEKVRKYRTEYYHRVSKKNPTTRLVINLRNRISKALNGRYKAGRTMELTGCTPEFLRQHLESQFTGNMSWDNYGPSTWHVDHIIKCEDFKLDQPDEQKACFHWSNLRPLDATLNCNKTANKPRFQDEKLPPP